MRHGLIAFSYMHSDLIVGIMHPSWWPALVQGALGLFFGLAGRDMPLKLASLSLADLRAIEQWFNFSDMISGNCSNLFIQKSSSIGLQGLECSAAFAI